MIKYPIFFASFVFWLIFGLFVTKPSISQTDSCASFIINEAGQKQCLDRLKTQPRNSYGRLLIRRVVFIQENKGTRLNYSGEIVNNSERTIETGGGVRCIISQGSYRIADCFISLPLVIRPYETIKFEKSTYISPTGLAPSTYKLELLYKHFEHIN
jgi:hypothetical protein